MDINADFQGRWGTTSRRKSLPSFTSMSKLIQAVARGDSAQVKSLLSSGAYDVNEMDGDKNTCLHLAAALDHLNVAQILIERGANLNARDCNWLTPMHRACRNNNDSIVKLLLEHEADVTMKDKEWITPLHVCAANNSLECVKLFASKLTNLDASDRSGATALHHAALNGNCDMINFLIAMGCSVNVFDKKSRRPMHYAASTDNSDAIRILIASGANIDAQDRTLKTPLHFAAASGSITAVQTLLDHGANITAVEMHGNNALHWAALNGQEDIIEELLTRNLGLINSTNSKGFTALHLAAGSAVGGTSLEQLTHHLPLLNINALDKRNRTAMHMAAKFGRLVSLQELIRCDADPMISEKGTMMIPLHYAIRSNNVQILDALLDRQALISVDVVDSSGMTPLHHAAFHSLPVMVKYLLSYRADPNYLDITGRPPCFLAALSGDLACLKYLMKAENQPFWSHLDNFNRSPLHYAAAAGPKAYTCLEYLLSIENKSDGSCPFNVNQQDIFGRSPLMYAAEFDSEGDAIELLITKGAQPDLADANGMYVLNYAAAAGNISALQSLVSIYYWNSLDFKLCPSQCAAFYGHSDCLELLLKASVFTDLKKSIEYSRRCSSSGCYEVIETFVASAPDTSIVSEYSEYFSASESFSNQSSSAFQDLSQLDSATLLSSPFKEPPTPGSSESSPTPGESQDSTLSNLHTNDQHLNNNYTSKKPQESELSTQQVQAEKLSNGSSPSRVVLDSSQSEF